MMLSKFEIVGTPPKHSRFYKFVVVGTSNDAIKVDDVVVVSGDTKRTLFDYKEFEIKNPRSFREINKAYQEIDEKPNPKQKAELVEVIEYFTIPYIEIVGIRTSKVETPTIEDAVIESKEERPELGKVILPDG